MNYITIDYLYIFYVILIDISLLFGSLYLFKKYWIPHLKLDINCKNYNFSNDTSYIIKLLTLLKDINNFEYYINFIGLEAYIYFLFLSSFFKTLFNFTSIQLILNLLFNMINIVINLEPAQNAIWNLYNRQTQVLLTVFIYSIIIINFILNFKLKIKRVFLKYFLNKNNIINNLKIKTLLIKSDINFNFNSEEIKKYFNNIFDNNNINGYIYYSKIIPNYCELLKLQMDRFGFQLNSSLFRNYYNNIIFPFMIKKFINKDLIYNNIKSIENKIDKIIYNNIIEESSYFFICVSSSDSFKYLNYEYNNKNIEIHYFVDPIDINWLNIRPKLISSILPSYFIKLIILFILLFLTTPAAFLQVIQKKRYINPLYTEKPEDISYINFWFNYYFPSLLIISINQILKQLIVRLTTLENNIRLSYYQNSILNRAFVYFMFNMFILPGFALPSLLEIYNFFVDNSIKKSNLLFTNFYLIDKGDFFVVLIFQSGILNFIMGILNISKLWGSRMTPLLSIEYLKNIMHKYYKYQTWTFAYGENYAQIIIFFLINSVYFFEISYLNIVFLLYLYLKLISDFHLLINFYGKEIESFGNIIENVLNKLLFCLIFSQICVFLYLYSSTGFYYKLLIIFLIIYTNIFYILLKKNKIIELEKTYFDYQEITKEDANAWHNLYTHPSILNSFNFEDFDNNKIYRKETNIDKTKEYSI